MTSCVCYSHWTG